ncbi:UNVERIFIED_CONTAM: hypothetical protein FKN15_070051 [Acipenser sinensis]
MPQGFFKPVQRLIRCHAAPEPQSLGTLVLPQCLEDSTPRCLDTFEAFKPCVSAASVAWVPLGSIVSDEESFLQGETQDPGLTQVMVSSSELASEPEVPALMERATNFLQVPWKAVSEQRRSVFRPAQSSTPPAFSSVPRLTGGGPECGRTCLHGRCRGGRAGTVPASGLHHSGPSASPPVGGLSKDPVCPNSQCRITEAHLKKAYAAEAQVTRLAITGGLLTAYLDGMLHSVTLPEPLASELPAVSGTLLQISGFQGQTLGRSLAGLVVARRQLWLSQVRVPDADPYWTCLSPLAILLDQR